MFQFPRCPPRTLCIQVRVTRVHLVGFPHSDMSGSTLATSSPDLFAGDRVLHRPLAPRHPPRALCSLTYFQHPAGPSFGTDGCVIGYGSPLAKLARSPRVERATIRYLSSSSSLVKVHHHSLGRGHGAREHARTDGERISPPAGCATIKFIPVPVETRRLELLTSSLQRRRSTN